MDVPSHAPGPDVNAGPDGQDLNTADVNPPSPSVDAGPDVKISKKWEHCLLISAIRANFEKKFNYSGMCIS